jgi:hypothetical protein
VQFPRVAIDEATRTSARAREEAVAHACELFRKHGCVVFDRLYSPEFVSDLARDVRRRHKLDLAGTDRPDRRPLFTVTIDARVADPELLANPFVLGAARELLGSDAILGAVSAVVSYPGAPQQTVHRDSESLFGDYALDVDLPPYALTVLAPLVDANAQTGSTRVWPGTHRIAEFDRAHAMPSEAPDLPVGSVLLTDSRVLHCGEPNRSECVRPVLYWAYHRAWFRDWGGYGERPPIRLGLGGRRKLRSQQALFQIADEGSRLERARWALKKGVARVLPNAWLRRALALRRGSRAA